MPWTEEHLAPPDAIPFSMPGVQLGTHDSAGSTFDKVMRKYKITDPSVAELGSVVRAGIAYVMKGCRPAADDRIGQMAVGLLAFPEGVRLTHQTDDGILAASLPVYDALYANFRVYELIKAKGLALPDHSDGRGPSSESEGLRRIYNDGGKPSPYWPAG